MAHRSMWSGTISVGLLDVPVSVVKGTDSYEGDEQLSEVCHCHAEPFARTIKCAVSGQARAAKGSGAGPEVRKAVQDATGAYRIVDDADLDRVKDAMNSTRIEIVAVQDYNAVPLDRTNGLYYVKFDRGKRRADAKRSQERLNMLHEALDGSRVLIGKWAPRGRERLVAIYSIGDVLELCPLLFDAEIREADGAIVEHRNAKTDAKMVGKVRQLLDAMTDDDLDYSQFEDESVALRADLIEQALAGTLQAPDDDDDADDDEPVEDLDDVLDKALAAL